MELTEVTADDLDELVERWYALATAMEDYSALNELAYEDLSEVSDDGFRAHLDDEAVTDYLIRDEGKPIGFVTLRMGQNPSRNHSEYLRIVNLAIDAEHQSRGHGTEVVERVKELADEWDCDVLKVSCEWDNERVRHFYRDTGFQPKQVDYAQLLE